MARSNRQAVVEGLLEERERHVIEALPATSGFKTLFRSTLQTWVRSRRSAATLNELLRVLHSKGHDEAVGKRKGRFCRWLVVAVHLHFSVLLIIICVSDHLTTRRSQRYYRLIPSFRLLHSKPFTRVDLVTRHVTRPCNVDQLLGENWQVYVRSFSSEDGLHDNCYVILQESIWFMTD